MIRTVNNVTRTLLFQASMPPSYWVDALATATYLINRLPTKTLNMSTPFFALHGTLPSYHDLRAFGCTCYPNLSATTPHKLAPRSTLCAFLGYSPDHKGYRCLDLNTNRVIISRHVVFDETTFPFSLSRPSPPQQELDFLTDDDTIVVSPLPAGTPDAAAPSQSVPLAPSLARAGMPASRAPVLPAPSTLAPPAVSRGSPVSSVQAPPIQAPAPPVVHVYSRRAPPR
jgi:hypothetical protein